MDIVTEDSNQTDPDHLRRASGGCSIAKSSSPSPSSLYTDPRVIVDGFLASIDGPAGPDPDGAVMSTLGRMPGEGSGEDGSVASGGSRNARCILSVV